MVRDVVISRLRGYSLGRIESQFLRGVRVGADRLRAAGRLTGDAVGEETAREIVEALRDPGRRVVALSPPAAATIPSPMAAGEAPRQLIGQPAAPGLATGRVRRVRGAADLARFHAREVLVCDAIQPTMTHLVPVDGHLGIVTVGEPKFYLERHAAGASTGGMM